jgi:hypothetical protein
MAKNPDERNGARCKDLGWHKALSSCSQLAVATTQPLGVPTPPITAFHHIMLEKSVPLLPASNSITTIPTRVQQLILRLSRASLQQTDITRAIQPAISIIFRITVLDVKSVNSIVHLILFLHHCDDIQRCLWMIDLLLQRCWGSPLADNRQAQPH